MARTRAKITQADIARAVRAAKQAGAAEVEVRVGKETAIVIRLASSTAPAEAVQPDGEIVL